jgi:hypothetical protein
MSMKVFLDSGFLSDCDSCHLPLLQELVIGITSYSTGYSYAGCCPQPRPATVVSDYRITCFSLDQVVPSTPVEPTLSPVRVVRGELTFKCFRHRAYQPTSFCSCGCSDRGGINHEITIEMWMRAGSRTTAFVQPARTSH